MSPGLCGAHLACEQIPGPFAGALSLASSVSGVNGSGSHSTGDGEADVHQAPGEVSSLLTECGAAEVMFSLAWCPGSGSPGAQPCHCVVSFPRDDAFSDSLSQKADSEASSGPLLDDKASSKNDIQSPTDHIMDYGFGGVMGR